MSDIDKAINLAEAKLKLNELNYSDRLRLLAQGALMNFSDEFFAMIRSIGTETYEEAVADEREELKKAQAKEGSLKYEIGGAMAPALALAPFTGGTSIPATIGRYTIGTGGRLMTQGAIQGGTSAVGRQEGDIVSRVVDNPLDVGVSTATGTLLNPAMQKVGGKIVEGVTKIAEPLIRKIRGQLGKPVEDELARIAKESGKEVGPPIAKERCESCLQQDIKIVCDELDMNEPWWRSLDGNRQRVVANMCFNLGYPRFSKFKKFIAAMQTSDWEKAAEEMMDSKWSTQVGERDTRLRESVLNADK